MRLVRGGCKSISSNLSRVVFSSRTWICKRVDQVHQWKICWVCWLGRHWIISCIYISPWVLINFPYLYWDSISLCSLGWPVTWDPPASVFWVLRLICTRMPGCLGCREPFSFHLPPVVSLFLSLLSLFYAVFWLGWNAMCQPENQFRLATGFLKCSCWSLWPLVPLGWIFCQWWNFL